LSFDQLPGAVMSLTALVKELSREVCELRGQLAALSENSKQSVNFIGIERQTTVIAIAARKIEQYLPNLALICDSAAKLSDLFEIGEIERIYLNFSDPWPKKRCMKRRLTYREFLQSYRHIMGEKGEIFFKTDNKGLFEFSLNEFCADKWNLSHICFDLHNSEYMQQNIMTEYEQKFSAMGNPIYKYCIYR